MIMRLSWIVFAATILGSASPSQAEITNQRYRLSSQAYTTLYGSPRGEMLNWHGNSLPVGILRGDMSWATNFAIWEDGGSTGGNTLIGGRNVSTSGSVSARTGINPLRVFGEARASSRGVFLQAVSVVGVEFAYTFTLNATHGYRLSGRVDQPSSFRGYFRLEGGSVNRSISPGESGEIAALGTLAPGNYELKCSAAGDFSGDARSWFDLQLSATDDPPGSSQSNPVLPSPFGPPPTSPGSQRRVSDESNPGGFLFFLGALAFFDPAMTPEFNFATLDGSAFKSIETLPVGIDADNLFTITAGTNHVGQFSGGQRVDFVALTGGPVGEFRVSGINPLVDSENPAAFPIKLSFLTARADFVMTPQPLPDFVLPTPWVSDDIGAPAVAGSSRFTNGTFIVAGSGEEPDDGGDSFQFAYRRLAGDCEIMAHLTSLETMDPQAEAGVMIRETLRAGSASAYAALSSSNGIGLRVRLLANAPSYVTRRGPAGIPSWIRLKRQGNRFTAYSSGDGSLWTQVASTEITMGTDICVGLAITSGSTNGLGSARFDQVNVDLSPRPASPPKAVLIHRYSFSDAIDSRTVQDSVGSADGLVVNSKGTNFNGTGQFAMSGGDASDKGATYIDLPDGLVSSLPSATIEGWVTWAGPNDSSWQRVFDFGRSMGGSGVGYMFLTPSSGLGTKPARFAVRPGTANEAPVLESQSAFPVGAPTHFAVTYDPPNGFAKLYLNGQNVAVASDVSPLSSVEDVNVWLGRSQWNDPFFTGSFDEFRIFEGLLSDAEIAASFMAGPNATLSSSALTARMDGASLALSWRAGTLPGFILQTASAIDGPWGTASVPLSTNQGVVTALVPVRPSVTNSFYRLAK